MSKPAPTIDDIRTWPATVTVPVACTVYGISNRHGYNLIRAGTFPAEILALGEKIKVVTSSILRSVGAGDGAGITEADADVLAQVLRLAGLEVGSVAVVEQAIRQVIASRDAKRGSKAA